MEFTRLTIVLVVSLAIFEFGAAIKCVEGLPGISISEVDCSGSCIKIDITIKGRKIFLLDCNKTKQRDACVQQGKINICSCSTDLCNEVDGAEDVFKDAVSGFVGGVFGGVSGLRAHTMPMAICLSVFVAKLYYF